MTRLWPHSRFWGSPEGKTHDVALMKWWQGVMDIVVVVLGGRNGFWWSIGVTTLHRMACCVFFVPLYLPGSMYTPLAFISGKAFLHGDGRQEEMCRTG